MFIYRRDAGARRALDGRAVELAGGHGGAAAGTGRLGVEHAAAGARRRAAGRRAARLGARRRALAEAPRARRGRGHRARRGGDCGRLVAVRRVAGRVRVVLHARPARLAAHGDRRARHRNVAVDHLGRAGREARHVHRVEAPREALGRAGERAGHLARPRVVRLRCVAGVEGHLVGGGRRRAERLHEPVELRRERLEVGGGRGGGVHRVPLALPPLGAPVLEPHLRKRAAGSVTCPEQRRARGIRRSGAGGFVERTPIADEIDKPVYKRSVTRAIRRTTGARPSRRVSRLLKSAPAHKSSGAQVRRAARS